MRTKLYFSIFITYFFGFGLSAMDTEDIEQWLKKAQKAYNQTEGSQRITPEETATRETLPDTKPQDKSVKKEKMFFHKKEKASKEVIFKESFGDEELNYYDKNSAIGRACTPRINFFKKGSPFRIQQDFHCRRLGIYHYCITHPVSYQQNTDAAERIRKNKGTLEDYHMAAIYEICNHSDTSLFLEKGDFWRPHYHVEHLCIDELHCTEKRRNEERQRIKDHLIKLQLEALKGRFKRSLENEISKLGKKDISLIEEVCFNGHVVEPRSPTYRGDGNDASSSVRYHCKSLSAMKNDICSGEWKKGFLEHAFWCMGYDVEDIAKDYGLLPEEVIQELAYIIKLFSDLEQQECKN